MARSAVVKPSSKGNVTAQDETESLPAVATSSTAQSYLIDTSIASLSAVDMSSAEGEDLPSPFADIPALVHDHSYLPKHFDYNMNLSTAIFRICSAAHFEEAVL